MEKNEKKKIKKWYKKWWGILIIIFVILMFIGLLAGEGEPNKQADDTFPESNKLADNENSNNQEKAKEDDNTTENIKNDEYDVTKIDAPNILGYKKPIVDYFGTSVLITYEATEDLKHKILSASAIVNVRENPNQAYDYTSFNEQFPIENQKIEIRSATGRVGYEDILYLKDLVVSQKYETIQVEVDNGNLHYAVQLGHSLENSLPDKKLYKEEAIKIMEILLSAYKY